MSTHAPRESSTPRAKRPPNDSPTKMVGGGALLLLLPFAAAAAACRSRWVTTACTVCLRKGGMEMGGSYELRRHTRTCIHIHIHVHRYIYTHTHIYIHLHTHMYVRTQQREGGAVVGGDGEGPQVEIPPQIGHLNFFNVMVVVVVAWCVSVDGLNLYIGVGG